MCSLLIHGLMITHVSHSDNTDCPSVRHEHTHTCVSAERADRDKSQDREAHLCYEEIHTRQIHTGMYLCLSVCLSVYLSVSRDASPCFVAVC
mmetsp:Transcript_53462/g.134565  ORF Transcript_53462/g.134565 Transcript_53462/m.134565 type:complete len:92 (-) Transcript_53462:144-419(-)